MSFRRWRIAKSDKTLSRSVAQRFGIDGFAAHLLTSRRFCSDGSISDMLGLCDDTAEFIDPYESSPMTSAPHEGQFIVCRFSLEKVSTEGLSQFI